MLTKSMPTIRLAKIFRLKKITFFLIDFFGQIGKRRRFIYSSVIMTLMILISSFLDSQNASFFLPVIVITIYLLTFFAILEGINQAEWLMLFLMPIYFTVCYYFFYFILPGRWLTRLPYISIYAVSIYALLLSSNILNVGVAKNLQLYRAAFSVGFLFLAISAYLAYSLILSFKIFPLFNLIAIAVATYPLATHFFWSINPKTFISKGVQKNALVVTAIVAEFGFILSFIPIKSSIYALFMAAGLYSLLGLFHAHIEERLFRNRIREYLLVIIFVSIITILSIRWS
ncbi:hypothetical protein A3J15_03505 [Candidatus Roizmanbacteria bacterium RIFCSPLOWO2_02_FULL_38_10]|uniref:Uncharacterized protein n=1 Tax=Candidatus Roizmanbacteria bacterium RIFCSPLOWO2_02_FULL_38_10 TaxID=1802074 RepID=A0A1F7JKW1_9BACT|nr:MAG: hypothetical protein A3J15_03505 [Candidatus Roizmanbacteria bacterium RIFCSPLOWO2_02_FULL_38_10]